MPNKLTFYSSHSVPICLVNCMACTASQCLRCKHRIAGASLKKALPLMPTLKWPHAHWDATASSTCGLQHGSADCAAIMNHNAIHRHAPSTPQHRPRRRCRVRRTGLPLPRQPRARSSGRPCAHGTAAASPVCARSPAQPPPAPAAACASACGISTSSEQPTIRCACAFPSPRM